MLLSFFLSNIVGPIFDLVHNQISGFGETEITELLIPVRLTFVVKKVNDHLFDDEVVCLVGKTLFDTSSVNFVGQKREIKLPFETFSVILFKKNIPYRRQLSKLGVKPGIFPDFLRHLNASKWLRVSEIFVSCYHPAGEIDRTGKLPQIGDEKLAPPLERAKFPKECFGKRGDQNVINTIGATTINSLIEILNLHNFSFHKLSGHTKTNTMLVKYYIYN